MKRLVETDRWKDSFFIELHPNAKLLLSYLYDNCNDAGFIDVNYSLWCSQLNMQKEHIIKSLVSLKPLLLSDTKRKLFIKDFLKHQKKLPLIAGNDESEWIIDKLKSNLDKFNNAIEIKSILESVQHPETKTKSKGSTKKKFIAPKYDIFEKYYFSQKADADVDDIKNLYDHYVSCDWKVGNKPMKDWEAAIRVSIRRKEKYEKNTVSNQKKDKPSKTQVTFSVVNELKEQNKNQTN